jgi:hypothetical protein
MQGSTTRSGAVGKATAKTYPKGLSKVSKTTATTYPKGLPKVSNNPRGPLPRKVKTAVPSSVVVISEPNGAPSEKQEGGTLKNSSEKKRNARRTIKQAVKEKKKKKKLLQVQKEEEDSLLDSYIARLDGEEQFLGDCAATEKQKKQEKKDPTKWGGSVSAPDAGGDKDDSVDESVTAGDLEESSPSTL